MLCTRAVLCASENRSTGLRARLPHKYEVTSLPGVAAGMAQDTQQQNGVQNTTSTGDAAKLHLPTGEIIELPMLVVRPQQSLAY